MHKYIRRVFIAVASCTAISALGITGASVSGAATGAPQTAKAASPAIAVPGAQLWVSRYNGPGNRLDQAQSVAVGPSGGMVFVTGISTGTASGRDYATAAYNTATGARLWVSRYNGPSNGFDNAHAIAVSPAGGRVFVTGGSFGTRSSMDYATAAYGTVTGKMLWAKRYNGPGNYMDEALAVAVSPDGNTVFVTGSSKGATSVEDYVTVAYSAASGKMLWAKRYNGPGNLTDVATSIAVSPGGGKVFVTGYSTGARSHYDYATVAYNAGTGKMLWAKRYNGPGNSTDQARSVAVSPSGGRVFVTGQSASARASASDDYATIAYRATTGARLWASRYNGPANRGDGANSVAVSRTGRAVFVTGYSWGGRSGDDYATVAYRATTGARLWASRYNGPHNTWDIASAIAVSPSGAKVFVTGLVGAATESGEYATIAYNTATGARLWASRYDGGGGASSLAVTRNGHTVLVTGASWGDASGWDYATVAYRG
jgi:WD40 repeat protein